MLKEIDRLDECVSRIDALEQRIQRLEHAPPGEALSEPLITPDAPVAEDGKSGVDLVTAMTLGGRALLVLGGAFLLRALTDAELFSQGLGVAFGVAYALLWVVFSDRSGARGDVTGAGAHAVVASIIGYPLLIETITRFGLLSTGVGAVAIGLFLALGVSMAAYRRLRIVAWAFVIGAMVAGWSLVFPGHALIPGAGVVLAIGLLTVWLSNGLGWGAMRWVAAIQTDVLVLVVGLLVLLPGSDSPDSISVSPATFRLLAGTLLVVYLGSFILWTVLRRRYVGGFEVVQSLFAVAIGYGGIVATRGNGEGGPIISLIALVCAAGCYAVGFSFGDRKAASRINFYLYTWLALTFVMLASAALAGGMLLTFALCGLAVLFTVVGIHYRRSTLQYQGAVYVAAAALQGGMAADVFRILLGSAKGAWPAFGPGYLAVLVTALACYILLLVAQRSQTLPWVQRTPRAVTVGLAVSAMGGILVVVLTRVLSSAPPAADPAVLAVIRTLVLAAAAIALGLFGQRERMTELAWLVFPVLVLGGAKLLLEDFRQGRPLTLFIGLACYGIALITVARMVRTRGAHGK